MDYEKLALEYHQRAPKGKISIRNTKPLETQKDLSLAYSPGVAGPCRVISEDNDQSFNFTTRSHLVGVISNGTAVLGLGNIGPYAAKPVMEGKGMLFKKFADIDVFDIEIAAEDPDEFIKIVKSLEPTFGGINLEDIKAPECFYIEEKLRSMMKIPVFHDDQHGTAIIAGAAFLNACELTKRKIEDTTIVFCGAGAAAISCAALFKTLGVKAANIIMCDSKGVIHTKRDDLNEYKMRFAQNTTKRSLEDALKGADAFIGVSSKDLMTAEMLRSMNKDPIVFALANPDPEINPIFAKEVRADVIVATGRSDFPNQVNNVLGFPYIFRGALDVRATTVNEEMKLAAVKAIADLAKEDVPEEVLAVYKDSGLHKFGREYLIPKPVDSRVLLRVAPAVAKAAMDSGVAKLKLDIEEYAEQIEMLLGPSKQMIRKLRREIVKVSSQKNFIPKIVLTAGEDIRVAKASKQLCFAQDVHITLVGNKEQIKQTFAENGIEIPEALEIIDPTFDKRKEQFAKVLFELRGRKGVSQISARSLIQDPHYFASIMLHLGLADGMICGIRTSYKSAVLPVLQIIRASEGKTLAGVYMITTEQRTLFFADCTINIDPTAEQLADIAISAAQVASSYTKDPVRVAMLSFASFGTSEHPYAQKVAKASAILRAKNINFELDGEMQVDVALSAELRESEFPFCSLTGDANVLIFPDVGSANMAYKILTNLSDATPTGPILVGLNKPAHVLQQSATVEEIVNMAYISAHEAAMKRK